MLLHTWLTSAEFSLKETLVITAFQSPSMYLPFAAVQMQMIHPIIVIP
jgi:hypothetical protein